MNEPKVIENIRTGMTAESLRPYADKVDVILFIAEHEELFPILVKYISGKTKKAIAERWKCQLIK